MRAQLPPTMYHPSAHVPTVTMPPTSNSLLSKAFPTFLGPENSLTQIGRAAYHQRPPHLTQDIESKLYHPTENLLNEGNNVLKLGGEKVPTRPDSSRQPAVSDRGNSIAPLVQKSGSSKLCRVLLRARHRK